MSFTADITKFSWETHNTAFVIAVNIWSSLRTKNDVSALVRGLKDDTIDAIVSNHYPLDIEDKRKAFFDTKYGAIGLENVFSVLNSKLRKKISLDVLIEKLSPGVGVFVPFLSMPHCV